MDRIGLLTIHDTINFGSQLQTYGLYKAVESLGCDVKLIDYKCDAIAARESTLPLREAKNIKDVVKSLILHGNLEKRKENFHQFMVSHMSISQEYNKNTIADANDNFDTFLVGSDIVWGLNITGSDFNYMLEFADDEKKKVSFSSSVGTKWSTEDEWKVQECLSRFDQIAVRESEAAEWIKPLVTTEVEVTCDPTMLWNRDFWGNLVHKPNKLEKYVLVYMSDPENVCVKRAIEYGKRHKMPVYYINYRAPVYGTVDKRPVSLEEWVSLFYYADVVFSASYHGLLYSLYFEKKVFYFNWTNKSRMNSLANKLSIENREGTLKNIEKDEPIHYDVVNQRLDAMRSSSWEILKRMLI